MRFEARPKKCARLCQSTDCWFTSRTNASCTSAVRWIVWFEALPPQMALRERAELLIDEAGQLTERGLVSATPTGEQQGDPLVRARLTRPPRNPGIL